MTSLAPVVLDLGLLVLSCLILLVSSKLSCGCCLVWLTRPPPPRWDMLTLLLGDVLPACPACPTCRVYLLGWDSWSIRDMETALPGDLVILEGVPLLPPSPPPPLGIMMVGTRSVLLLWAPEEKPPTRPSSSPTHEHDDGHRGDVGGTGFFVTRDRHSRVLSRYLNSHFLMKFNNCVMVTAGGIRQKIKMIRPNLHSDISLAKEFLKTTTQGENGLMLSVPSKTLLYV